MVHARTDDPVGNDGQETLDLLGATGVLQLVGGMVALALVDLQGEFSWVSDRWCAIVGMSRPELLGRRWTEVIHPDQRDEVAAACYRAMEERQELRVELQVAGTADGDEPTWIQAQLTTLTDAGGETAGWLVAGVDITELKSASEGRHRSERRLYRIVNSMSDVVSVLSADGRWRSTSGGGSRILGYPPDYTPPADGRGIIHPDDVAEAIESVQAIVADKESTFGKLFEFRVKAADGSWRWFETAGVNLVDDPDVRGLVLSSRDVTERHEAVEALRSTTSRLSLLLDNLLVGVLMTDEQMRIIIANRALADLFNLAIGPDELIGQRVSPLPEPYRRQFRDPDTDAGRFEQVHAEQSLVVGERVELADGRTLSRSFVPVFVDDEYRGHLWLFHDLTQEVALAAEGDYLLAVEKEQNARLTELDAMKSEFVASVSHELRTPLTAIVSFTQLLRDSLGDGESLEYLDIIDRNTSRLLRLVDDLLLLDRLESNSLQITVEPADPASLVELAVSSITPFAESSGVALSCRTEPGPPILGDVDRLGQLMDNLLTNAVKFTPAGGRVEVSARPAGAGWRIEVSDTGIGIPADELPQLFERFFRASNARSRATPGSGLGLPIALRIAELHRGGIEVTSEAGRGTAFVATVLGAETSPPLVSPLARTRSER
ncbi:MAG TPA: PAS domain S-box protein [Acidimicrobiales bacterium]|nr:PAS domain S-box protein [Acidimicrobiales bacterium]